MLCAPKLMPVEVSVSLWGSAGAFFGGLLPWPLWWKLSQGHLLRKHSCKVSSQRNSILKQNQAKTTYNSLQHTNINVNLEQTHTPMHVFFWDVHIFTHISLRRYIYEHTCVQDILLPIPTYRRIQSIFLPTFTYMHFQSIFAKFTYIHTQGILAT